jgi:CDP-glucose 4,6-dehydratase
VFALIHRLERPNDDDVRELFARVVPIFASIGDSSRLQQALADHRIDTIFHLAGLTTEGPAFADPAAAFEVNAAGTAALMEAARRVGPAIRGVILASSDKVYGEGERLPVREGDLCRGRRPFAASRLLAEQIALNYYRAHGVPVLIGRFANVFGPGDLNWSRLIPATLRRLLHGQPPVVKVSAMGAEFSRDFLFVADAVDSYLAMNDALDQPSLHGEIFNFSSGVATPVVDIVRILEIEVAGAQRRWERVPADHGEILSHYLDCSKAARALGWAPIHSLEESLAVTATWYRKYFSPA